MVDESEIKITIVDDEKSNVETAATTEKKTDAVTVETKDPALQDLMAQYKELETKSAAIDKRRKEAEDEASRQRQEAARHRDDAEVARKRETSSQLDTIKTALSASEQDVDGAKAAIRAAKASGDVEAEIEAQDRLAKARATMLRLDEAQQDIEARQKTPPKREVSTDPVEAFVQGRTEPTAAWVRAHPEYVRSERGLKKLVAADAVAQAEDLLPDTPEYFARVEEYLGIKKGEAETSTKEAPTEASQVTGKTRAAPPVAPGSAISSNGTANGSAVQLSKREADAATDGTLIWNYDDPSGKSRFKKGDPIGLQEAARRKLALQKQGAYDRTYSEG